MASSSSFAYPHSCHVCHKFVLGPERTSQDEELWFAGPPGSRVRNWVEKMERRGATVPLELIVFDATIADVKVAAAAGCSFCKYIVDCSIGKALDDESLLAAEIWGTGAWVMFGIGIVRKDDDDFDSGFVYLDQFENSIFDIGILKDEDVDPNTKIWCLNSQPNSRFSCQLMTNWFNSCKESHKECHANQTSFQPTRLIEIKQKKGRRIIRLCEKSSINNITNYAALSYCWGQNLSVTTTNLTIKRHLSGMSMTDLPLTIQHAILVAELLGLCYLWVDALCIIQDDEDDKSREIAQMPGIYMGASITICASRASDAREGFLHEREPEDKFKIGFKLPFRDKNGVFSTIILDHYNHNRLEPLQERAWALQEEWLSPKILNLGTYVTSWKCKEILLNDRTTQLRQNLNYLEQHGKSSQSSVGQEPCNMLKKASLEWQDIVEDYTSRDLTFSIDRLPAISGIAEQFSHRMGDNVYYAAGLWSSTMLHDLLWYCNQGFLVRRPTEYQGPSWSWASVNGRVHFRSQYTTLKVDIISCNVELAKKEASGVDVRFGAVTSGRLEIQGVLHKAEVMHSRYDHDDSDDDDSDDYPHQLQVVHASVGGSNFCVSWFPDTLDDVEPERETSTVREAEVLYTLMIAAYSNAACFLVLKQDDATGYFTRCGLIDTGYQGSNSLTPEQLSWLRGGELQKIVII